MKLCKENLLEIISILERYQKEETKWTTYHVNQYQTQKSL
jgi:hypothetical protein